MADQTMTKADALVLTAVGEARGCIGPFPCGRAAGAHGDDLQCDCEHIAGTLTDRQRCALWLLADCAEPGDPWGVVTSSGTARYDGQAWINYRTVSALKRHGLVVTDDDYDPEGTTVCLAHAVAKTGKEDTGG